MPSAPWRRLAEGYLNTIRLRARPARPSEPFDLRSPRTLEGSPEQSQIGGRRITLAGSMISRVSRTRARGAGDKSPATPAPATEVDAAKTNQCSTPRGARGETLSPERPGLLHDAPRVAVVE